MEFPVPDYIKSISPYIPGKPINETRRELGLGPKDPVVKLASNENPLGPSPRAIAAIRKHLKEVHLYPDAHAHELRIAIQEKVGVRGDQILIGNGSNEVIDLLIRTFCVAGDAMVTTEKAFIAFRICAQIHGVRTIEAPLDPSLRPELGAMLERIRADSRARMVFLANPNNPTGTYVKQAELTEFLNGVAAIRGGSVIVVLDSAYLEYVDAPDFPDPLELMKRFGNVVVMRTFSKIYGLAALRVGYALGRNEIISSVEKVRQPFNTGALSQIAAAAAIFDAAHVRKSRTVNKAGRKFWEAFLERRGIAFAKSQGNFVLADFKRLGKFGNDLYLDCLKQSVILRPAANYGMPHSLRITFGKQKENERAARALDRALGNKAK